ncbi:RBP11-like subunits of RNA polymerase [Suillus paluster]|uniref:RBP11-like subunits of RNA polymerase n=1 Tax=Suillus paluster TaxID=48578 RepID=UPI001B865EBE|nr:RBP11-like subunits of RNA polymerase [Suillus paluster]KAG1731846.1 RBP11-like subunits of RNA polymerase [Suillus paluster]
MAEATPKIKIVPYDDNLKSPRWRVPLPDLSAATYQIFDESHTIGNALRWMIMKNPKVEFCGYSVPHPSENHIQLRIQMYDGLSSLNALLEALTNLDDVCETIENKYHESLATNDYERWEEKS